LRRILLLNPPVDFHVNQTSNMIDKLLDVLAALGWSVPKG